MSKKENIHNCKMVQSSEKCVDGIKVVNNYYVCDCNTPFQQSANRSQYKKSPKITKVNVVLALEGLGITLLFFLAYLGVVPFLISAIVSATVVLIQLFVIVNKYNSNDKKPKKEKIQSEKKNVKYATASDLK